MTMRVDSPTGSISRSMVLRRLSARAGSISQISAGCR
jgi:hypothetical protein